jgi:hypothetical protein
LKILRTRQKTALIFSLDDLSDFIIINSAAALDSFLLQYRIVTEML